jgi:hypothetical protein
MSNPGDRATLDPIDSGTPRRTMVLRPPGSANIRLTRVAHSNPDRHPPSRPHTTRHHQRQMREIHTPPLTKASPYQVARPFRRRSREPPFGNERVSDQCSDACFPWRNAPLAGGPLRHTGYHRGAAAALVLSRKGTRRCGMVRASEINGKSCSAAGGCGRPAAPGSASACRCRVGLSCGSARTAQPTRGRPSMAACFVLSRADGASAARWRLPGSCSLASVRPGWW